MPGVERKSWLSWMHGPGLSAGLAVFLAGAEGCAALPALSFIPSAISLAGQISTKSGEDGAELKNQDAALAAGEPSSLAPKLTPGNLCQMIAIAWPDLVVVELRRDAAGAPEYRELRLLNSTDDARWTPIVDGNSGPGGWRPAVNFLSMDFKPPLTDAIPDSGSCYLAYAPAALDRDNPGQPAELKLAPSGTAGVFSWGGRMYQYVVARTLPCLPPSS